MPDNATIQTQTAQVQTHVEPDFGTGRYSALMQECYTDAQTVFHLAPEKSEKLARQIASDLGAIMAAAPVNVKLGKVNKDGKLTIAEAARMKGVTLTNTIYALRALHYAGEAGQYGFSFGQTGWKVNQSLDHYLKSL